MSCFPAAYLGADWRKNTRARILRISTASVMNSDPAHANSCQSLYGLMANWKMTTGRFDIGALRLVVQNWLFSDVNSNGAVSPEIRATASRIPVMTPARTERSVTMM